MGSLGLRQLLPGRLVRCSRYVGRGSWGSSLDRAVRQAIGHWPDGSWRKVCWACRHTASQPAALICLAVSSPQKMQAEQQAGCCHGIVWITGCQDGRHKARKQDVSCARLLPTPIQGSSHHQQLTSSCSCMRSVGHAQVHRARRRLPVLWLTSIHWRRWQLLLAPRDRLAGSRPRRPWVLVHRLLVQPGRHLLWESHLCTDSMSHIDARKLKASYVDSRMQALF